MALLVGAILTEGRSFNGMKNVDETKNSPDPKLGGILLPPPGVSQAEWEEHLGVSDEGIITLKGENPDEELARRVAQALLETAEEGKIDLTESEPDNLENTEAIELDEAPEPSQADAADEAAQPKHAKKKSKATRITLIVLLVLLAAVYGAGVGFFQSHFFPHTTVGNTDISFMENQEAKAKLDADSANYTLEVIGYGLNYGIAATDFSYQLDSAATLDAIESDQNPWFWPRSLLVKANEGVDCVVSYDEDKLNLSLSATVLAFNETAKAPADATLVWDSETKTVSVKSEEAGTQLIVDDVLTSAHEAARAMESAPLNKKHLIQPEITSDDPSLNSLAALTNACGLPMPDVTLMYEGEIVAQLNPSVVAYWLDFADDGSAAINDGRLVAWCKDLAERYSTLYSTRVYKRPDGKICQVSGGTYGVTVNQNALISQVRDLCATAATGVAEVPFSGNGGVSSDPTVPDWGKRYIDVDITEQHVRFYDDNGTLVWESDCVTGSPGRDTTVGVWTIFHMASPTVLVGPGYASPVSYWMKFTSSGIGLHDATWQTAFGGTRYVDGYGSHGCVNLPLEAAGQLYDLVHVGDVVVTHF